MQLTKNYFLEKFNYLELKKDSVQSPKINVLLKRLFYGNLYFSSLSTDKQANVNKQIKTVDTTKPGTFCCNND